MGGFCHRHLRFCTCLTEYCGVWIGGLYITQNIMLDCGVWGIIPPPSGGRGTAPPFGWGPLNDRGILYMSNRILCWMSGVWGVCTYLTQNIMLDCGVWGIIPPPSGGRGTAPPFGWGPLNDRCILYMSNRILCWMI
jgi:hypothetical protein